MPRPTHRLLLLALCLTPFVVAFTQQPQQPQTAEQVFKNIQVFKGVPASDLIPSMEFMAASLKIECADCHDAKDFSKDTRMKETARHMILMQRDINEKNFGGRTQVTCMTCHRQSENPRSTPLPEGLSLRHQRLASAPNPEDLIAKHLAAEGTQANAALVRVGTMTAPNDVTHKPETNPVEFVQAPGGKFRLVSASHKVMSDGAQVWYGTAQMFGEPAAIFGRVGRSWRSNTDFSGLERPTVAGQDAIGKEPILVVRANRPSTDSTEELWFDAKSNLLVRLVNIRRSSLGAVVSTFDYSNFRKVGGMQVPMKVVMTFPGGTQWTMDFKTAKLDPSVGDAAFKPTG